MCICLALLVTKLLLHCLHCPFVSIYRPCPFPAQAPRYPYERACGDDTSKVPARTCLRRNDGPSEQFTCLRIPPTLSTRTNVPAEKTPPPRYKNERACEITTSPRYTNERACEETAPPSHSDERAYGETTAPSEQFWCLRVPTPPSTRPTTVPALGETPGCTYQ